MRRTTRFVDVADQFQFAVYDILDELDPKGHLVCEINYMPNGYGVNVIIRRKHRWAYSKLMFLNTELHEYYMSGNLDEMIRPEITKAIEKEL